MPRFQPLFRTKDRQKWRSFQRQGFERARRVDRRLSPSELVRLLPQLAFSPMPVRRAVSYDFVADGDTHKLRRADGTTVTLARVKFLESA